MASRFFYFPKGDRRALITLAIGAALSMGVLVGRSCRDNASTETMTEERADSLMALITATDTIAHLSPFDPNTVSAEELIRMGFSKRQAYNLLASRERGHVFRSVYDVLTVYGWENEDLQSLSKAVVIADEYKKKTTTRNYHREQGDAGRMGIVPHSGEAGEGLDSASRPAYPERNKFRERTTVDPNTADTTLLMRIPGIGPYFAREIVWHRERLGGFNNVGQLLEIDRFPEETLEWFGIDTPQVRTLDLTTATQNDLARHPYIGWRRARALGAYQRLHGPIKTLDALRNTHLFPEDTLVLLAPYLQWEDAAPE